MGHLSLYPSHLSTKCSYQGISGMNMAQPMQQLLLEEEILHHLRCSKPCTFPLSSWLAHTYQLGLRVFIPLVCMVLYIFQVMRDFFHQSHFIGELSILSGRQACGHAVISPVSYSKRWDTAFQTLKIGSTPRVEVTEAHETFDFEKGFLWPRSVQGVDHGGKPTGQTKMRCQCPVHSIIA